MTRNSIATSTASTLLNVFRRIDRDMTMQQAEILLAAHGWPGIDLRDLSREIGQSRSRTMRDLAILSTGTGIFFRTPGHDLVELRASPDDPRRLLVDLTPKGQAVIAKVEAVIG